MRENLCPELRWVPVVDGAGRRRLEMRWEQPGTVVAGRFAAPAALRSHRAA
ncbi:hypothetical protein [Modestobacter sp. SSW1-42]|uniref:hypothetical protein n=1 Tax=Modestobacter sp. SSW1-42 TaxID=596372 RepID=UPI003987F62F